MCTDLCLSGSLKKISQTTFKVFQESGDLQRRRENTKEMQRKAIPIGRSSLHLRNVTALSSIWVPLSISSQRCTPLPFNAMFPSSITSRCDSSSFYPHKPLNRRAFATSSVAADLKKNTVTLTQRAVQVLTPPYLMLR